ncbi:hypothetical protein TCSYLVIO_005666 [Trypanosoma cruzi]|nr:hypothetical protein TCSYLVIO_005666 [Trypanosoma cruzi]
MHVCVCVRRSACKHAPLIYSGVICLLPRHFPFPLEHIQHINCMSCMCGFNAFPSPHPPRKHRCSRRQNTCISNTQIVHVIASSSSKKKKKKNNYNPFSLLTLPLLFFFLSSPLCLYFFPPPSSAIAISALVGSSSQPFFCVCVCVPIAFFKTKQKSTGKIIYFHVHSFPPPRLRPCRSSDCPFVLQVLLAPHSCHQMNVRREQSERRTNTHAQRKKKSNSCRTAPFPLPSSSVLFKLLFSFHALLSLRLFIFIFFWLFVVAVFSSSFKYI